MKHKPLQTIKLTVKEHLYTKDIKISKKELNDYIKLIKKGNNDNIIENKLTNSLEI